jgi:hypothetical protein
VQRALSEHIPYPERGGHLLGQEPDSFPRSVACRDVKRQIPLPVLFPRPSSPPREKRREPPRPWVLPMERLSGAFVPHLVAIGSLSS